MIAGGIQLPFFQHRPRGENSGNAPFYQFSSLSSFQLVADRNLMPSIQKLGQIPFRCMKRDTRHRHLMTLG